MTPVSVYGSYATGTDWLHEVRRFNPTEPRVPGGEHGGGRWTDGMPSAIIETAVKVAGGLLHVSAEHDDQGRATLRLGDRRVSLDDREIEEFRKAIIDARYDSDQHRDGYGLFAVRRHGAPDEPHEPLVALRPVPGKYVTETGKKIKNLDDGPDDEEVYNAEFELFVGRSPNDPDRDFGSETEHGLIVSLNDLDIDKRGGLHQSLLTATSARRIDTGNGPTDIYTPRTGRLALRMKDESGNPTEVEFNAGEWRRIDDAVNIVIEGYDESKIPARAPDDFIPPAVNRLVVDTAAGPVEVKWRGPRPDNGYSPDSTLTITPMYDAPWGLAVDGDHMSDLFQAMSLVSEDAGIQRSYHGIDIETRANSSPRSIRPELAPDLALVRDDKVTA